MGHVQKLPFILGAASAIVIGLIGMKYGLEQQKLYVRMAIGMVVFFALGVYVRNLITGLVNDLEEKKRKEEEAELEELRRQEELENMKMAEQKKENAGKNTAESKSTVDYRVDNDYGEDFEPLTVREFLKKDEA